MPSVCPACDNASGTPLCTDCSARFWYADADQLLFLPRRPEESSSPKVRTPGRVSAVLAKYSGRCSWCGQNYTPGTQIKRMAETWVHAECWSGEVERQRVLSGDSYRARPAKYKRKRRRA